MQHCNVEDISLQPPRLEAEEVREKNPYDTVHWGRREAANMNVVTGNNNGRKDMVQVFCSMCRGEQNNIGCH